MLKIERTEVEVCNLLELPQKPLIVTTAAFALTIDQNPIFDFQAYIAGSK
jgi:hypothetical protein